MLRYLQIQKRTRGRHECDVGVRVDEEFPDRKKAGPAVRQGARDTDRVRHLGEMPLRFERYMGRRGEPPHALKVEAGADESEAVDRGSSQDGEGRKTPV